MSVTLETIQKDINALLLKSNKHDVKSRISHPTAQWIVIGIFITIAIGIATIYVYRYWQDTQENTVLESENDVDDLGSLAPKYKELMERAKTEENIDNLNETSTSQPTKAMKHDPNFTPLAVALQ